MPRSESSRPVIDPTPFDASAFTPTLLAGALFTAFVVGLVAWAAVFL